MGLTNQMAELNSLNSIKYLIGILRSLVVTDCRTLAPRLTPQTRATASKQEHALPNHMGSFQKFFLCVGGKLIPWAPASGTWG